MRKQYRPSLGVANNGLFKQLVINSELLVSMVHDLGYPPFHHGSVKSLVNICFVLDMHYLGVGPGEILARLPWVPCDYISLLTRT